MTPRALISTVAAVVAIASLTGCSSLGEKTVGTAVSVVPGEHAVLEVTTTTNFITDTVQQVGGQRVAVSGLLGPGVDPHLYKASAGDVEILRNADIIFYGGLLLEAKMGEVLGEIGKSRPAIAVTDTMPREDLLPAPGGAPAGEEYDPHVWFDINLWKYAVTHVADSLAEADPDGAPVYRRNARSYIDRLTGVDRELRAALDTIPPDRRLLATSHDAFRYFGRAYGIEVAAIQGISTASEASTADIERVAAVVAEHDVRSVFIESAMPRQTIEAVLAATRERGQEAEIGGQLYADSAGDAGTPEGTYIGMLKANVATLVEGLK